MIFELAEDLREALQSMPRDHPKYSVLELLEEGLNLDIHFIARHPTTLFQCIWNTCWWHDCAVSKAQRGHFSVQETDEAEQRVEERTISSFLESWHQRKEKRTPGFRWVRSHRAPPLELGTTMARVIASHDGAVSGVASTPDGAHTISTSTDGSIQKSKSLTGREVFKVNQYPFPPTAMSIGPDGDQIATCSRGRYVNLYDTRTGARVCRARGGTCSAFSPDGHTIITGTTHGDIDPIRLTDSKTGNLLQTFTGDYGAVYGIAYSPKGKQIATCGKPFSSDVRVWAINFPDQLQLIYKFDSGHSCLSFSPDGRYLLASGDHLGAQVWHMDDGTEVCRLRGHTGIVTCSAFSPSGNNIVTGSSDSTVRIWDAHSGREINCLRGHNAEVTCVSYCPDDSHVLSGSKDGTVRRWYTEPHGTLNKHQDRSHHINNILLAPNGSHIVSISSEPAIHIENVHNGEVIHEWKLPRSELFTKGHAFVAEAVFGLRIIMYTESGKLLVLGEGHDAPVIHRECTDSDRSISSTAPENRYGMTISEDARLLAVWEQSQATIQCFCLETGREIFTSQEYTSKIRGVAFSPNGRRIANLVGDYTFQIRDLDTSAISGPWDSIGRASYLKFSPDGGAIVSANRRFLPPTPEVLIVDAVTGGHLMAGTLAPHFGSPLSRVAFSQDGTVLAVHCRSGVVLWHRNTADNAPQLKHPGWQSSASDPSSNEKPWLSPPAPSLHRKRDDFWVSPVLKQVAELGGDRATCVAVSPIGDLVACGTEENGIELFNGRDGSLLIQRKAHIHLSSSLEFSADGTRLICRTSGEEAVTVIDCQNGRVIGRFDNSSLAGISSTPNEHRFEPVCVGEPLYALSQAESELSIADCETSQAVAWYSRIINKAALGAGGRTWAGVLNNRVEVLSLEASSLET